MAAYSPAEIRNTTTALEQYYYANLWNAEEY
jgi:hypothetical protein